MSAKVPDCQLKEQVLPTEKDGSSTSEAAVHAAARDPLFPILAALPLHGNTRSIAECCRVDTPLASFSDVSRSRPTIRAGPGDYLDGSSVLVEGASELRGPGCHLEHARRGAAKHRPDRRWSRADDAQLRPTRRRPGANDARDHQTA